MDIRHCLQLILLNVNKRFLKCSHNKNVDVEDYFKHIWKLSNSLNIDDTIFIKKWMLKYIIAFTFLDCFWQQTMNCFLKTYLHFIIHFTVNTCFISYNIFLFRFKQQMDDYNSTKVQNFYIKFHARQFIYNLQENLPISNMLLAFKDISNWSKHMLSYWHYFV